MHTASILGASARYKASCCLRSFCRHPSHIRLKLLSVFMIILFDTLMPMCVPFDKYLIVRRIKFYRTPKAFGIVHWVKFLLFLFFFFCLFFFFFFLFLL